MGVNTSRHSMLWVRVTGTCVMPDLSAVNALGKREKKNRVTFDIVSPWPACSFLFLIFWSIFIFILVDVCLLVSRSLILSNSKVRIAWPISLVRSLALSKNTMAAIPYGTPPHAFHTSKICQWNLTNSWAKSRRWCDWGLGGVSYFDNNFYFRSSTFAWRRQSWLLMSQVMSVGDVASHRSDDGGIIAPRNLAHVDRGCVALPKSCTKQSWHMCFLASWVSLQPNSNQCARRIVHALAAWVDACACDWRMLVGIEPLSCNSSMLVFFATSVIPFFLDLSMNSKGLWAI